MSHQALTLQIARQAGPNYTNHTNRATHRPTWLEGASQSCLIYDTPQNLYVARLPNRLPVLGNHNLQPVATIFLHLQGASQVGCHLVLWLCLALGCNHALACVRFLARKRALLWFSTCESDRGWGLLFYLWPLQGPEKGRFSQSHPLITPSPANHQASSSTFLQNEGVPPRFTLNPKVWPLPTLVSRFPDQSKQTMDTHTCAQTHTYQSDMAGDRPALQWSSSHSAKRR